MSNELKPDRYSSRFDETHPDVGRRAKTHGSFSYRASRVRVASVYTNEEGRQLWVMDNGQMLTTNEFDFEDN